MYKMKSIVVCLLAIIIYPISCNSSQSQPEINIPMILVQGGTFMMGSEKQEKLWDEYTVHKVTVSNFYIGKYEITQAQWVAIMGENPSKIKGDNLPVENVSWLDVHVFIEKLNKVTNKQYRLPTEAEWEFAARGGKNSKGYKYSAASNNDCLVYWKRKGKPSERKGINGFRLACNSVSNN